MFTLKQPGELIQASRKECYVRKYITIHGVEYLELHWATEDDIDYVIDGKQYSPTTLIPICDSATVEDIIEGCQHLEPVLTSKEPDLTGRRVSKP